MDAKIVEFCQILRDNGVRVSVAEVLDALRVMELVDLGERDAVRAALRATTVKRVPDVPIFDALFDVFFSGVSQAIASVNDATTAELALEPRDLAALGEELEALAREAGVDLGELTAALLRGDAGALEGLLRQAADRAGISQIEHAFQEGRYLHAMAAAIGAPDVTAEFDALRQALGERDDPEAERLRRYLDRRLQDLRELLRAMVRRQLEQMDVGRRERGGAEALAEKSFFYLTEQELRQMEDAVVRLARRLRSAVALRRRHARRGAFDSSATLRRNLQYGGVPFRVVFERRRREKPQVVVLCDVSDSVRNVSRFMLQFVYALQDLYTKVRSFIFVADIGEVTSLFQDLDAGEAMEQALKGRVINVYAHSDFGRAFRTFHREHLPVVNKRTTVLILGDARNNYNVAHEWTLRDVQRRAKRVIWLNPENRNTWGFGDSEMDRYAMYCDVVEECRNLRQLYRLVDRLVTA